MNFYNFCMERSIPSNKIMVKLANFDYGGAQPIAPNPVSSLVDSFGQLLPQLMMYKMMSGGGGGGGTGGGGGIDPNVLMALMSSQAGGAAGNPAVQAMTEQQLRHADALAEIQLETARQAQVKNNRPGRFTSFWRGLTGEGDKRLGEMQSQMGVDFGDASAQKHIEAIKAMVSPKEGKMIEAQLQNLGPRLAQAPDAPARKAIVDQALSAALSTNPKKAALINSSGLSQNIVDTMDTSLAGKPTQDDISRVGRPGYMGAGKAIREKIAPLARKAKGLAGGVFDYGKDYLSGFRTGMPAGLSVPDAKTTGAAHAAALTSGYGKLSNFIGKPYRFINDFFDNLQAGYKGGPTMSSTEPGVRSGVGIKSYAKGLFGHTPPKKFLDGTVDFEDANPELAKISRKYYGKGEAHRYSRPGLFFQGLFSPQGSSSPLGDSSLNNLHTDARKIQAYNAGQSARGFLSMIPGARLGRAGWNKFMPSFMPKISFDHKWKATPIRYMIEKRASSNPLSGTVLAGGLGYLFGGPPGAAAGALGNVAYRGLGKAIKSFSENRDLKKKEQMYRKIIDNLESYGGYLKSKEKKEMEKDLLTYGALASGAALLGSSFGKKNKKDSKENISHSKTSSEYGDIKSKIESLSNELNLNRRKSLLVYNMLAKDERMEKQKKMDVFKKFKKGFNKENVLKSGLLVSGGVLGLKQAEKGLDFLTGFKERSKTRSRLGKAAVFGTGLAAYLRSKTKNNDDNKKTAMEKQAFFGMIPATFGKIQGATSAIFNNPLNWLKKPLGKLMRSVNQKSRRMGDIYRENLVRSAAKRGHFIDPYALAGKIPPPEKGLYDNLFAKVKDVSKDDILTQAFLLSNLLPKQAPQQTSSFGGSFMDSLPPAVKNYGLPALAGLVIGKTIF